MLFGIIPLSLSALIVVCTLARQAAARRAAAAAAYVKEQAAAMKKAAQEQARRDAQEKAAQERAARSAQAAAKKAAAEQKRQERAARAADAHALKVARAAELAELAERRLQAEKELAALHQAAATTPDDHSEPEQPAQEQATPAAPTFTLEQFTQAAAPAPQPFKGHTVAFTGRLAISGMTHAQAAAKVKELGGTAFTKEMPSFTTLLVVGENPGMKKQDKADAWISQVKKLTEEQFLDMLAA